MICPSFKYSKADVKLLYPKGDLENAIIKLYIKIKGKSQTICKILAINPRNKINKEILLADKITFTE